MPPPGKTAAARTVRNCPADRRLTGPPARSLRIGDRLLLAPRHVCPTVNLWGSFDVIGPGGEVEIADCPVDGRNP